MLDEEVGDSRVAQSGPWDTSEGTKMAPRGFRMVFKDPKMVPRHHPKSPGGRLKCLQSAILDIYKMLKISWILLMKNKSQRTRDKT